jgi:hypothetical protein
MAPSNESEAKSASVGPPLILACQVSVVFPLLIYLGNISETGISLSGLLGASLVVAILAFFLLVGVRRVLPEASRSVFNGLLSVLAILFWIQGTVLVRDYGALNGASVDWDTYGRAGLIDSVIWIAAIGIGIALIRSGKSTLLFRTAGFLLAIQFASTLVDAGLKYDEIEFREEITYNTNPLTFYDFSKTKNVIHILADGFQSDVFADLISNPETGPTYAESFSGFVYFEEALGVFPYTQFSLPALLTGKTYLNKETKNEFLDRTMSGRSILSVAGQHGFEIDIAASGQYLYGQYDKVPHDNIFYIDSLGKSNPLVVNLLRIADVTIFRLVPHAFKPFVYNDQKWLLQSSVVENESFKYQFFQHTHFLEELTSNLSVSRDVPVYKYIHVANTHRPMVADINCGYAGRTFGDSRSTLTVQSKCTLDTLARLFDRLKAVGIYDSSLIVLHSDHGGWVPNRRRGKAIRLADNRTAPGWLASLASPLLAVKLPGSEGEIETSRALVSLLDLPDTLSVALGLDEDFGHQSVFDASRQPNRIRRFNFYWWQRGEWEAQYVQPIQEFMIPGSHYENEWVLRKIHARQPN